MHDELLPATQAADAPADLAHRLADDFLRALAMLLMAWSGSRIDATAGAQAPRRSQASRTFWRWIWPEHGLRLGILRSALAGG